MSRPGTVAGGAAGASPGTGATAGSAFGSSIFVQGSGDVITFSQRATGQTTTVTGTIADQNGSITTGYATQTASITITGPGTVVLSAANSFTGWQRRSRAMRHWRSARGGAGTGPILFSHQAHPPTR